MSWGSLVAIVQEAAVQRRDERRQRRCPLCLDVLGARPDGSAYCENDGWPGTLRPALVAVRTPQEQPVACPNDGWPLDVGPDGRLFCVFDGWRSTT